MIFIIYASVCIAQCEEESCSDNDGMIVNHINIIYELFLFETYNKNTGTCNPNYYQLICYNYIT